MHGGAYPHRGPLGAALAGMTEVRDQYDIVAWKIYTMVPTDEHFFFDDHDKSRPQIGQRFIDHVREIGPQDHLHAQGHLVDRRIHARARRSRATSGRPRSAIPTSTSSCTTPGSSPAAEASVRTTRTIPRRRASTASSVRSSRPASNRTATCTRSSAAPGGSSCAIPPQAAHVLGKLLKYVGEERVLWGTDSIWFGTPQDQIQAMRTFQIGEALQEAARLPEAHARDQGRDLRAQRGRALRHRTDRRPLRAERDATSRRSGRRCRRRPRTGPRPSADAARMIAAHQAGYML